MDEHTWWTGHDLAGMKQLARFSQANRKLRLFGCACCRRIWPILNRKKLRQAIEVAERFADGRAREDERNMAYRSVAQSLRYYDVDTVEGQEELHACLYVLGTPAFAGTFAPEMALEAKIAHHPRGDVRTFESEAQMALLRDIFGPLLFRWIEFDPEWHNWNEGRLGQLALTIYEEERVDLLPILADALQEAGCTDADVLTHCHGAGPHVRGCWVVDWVLGR
jgi:hypothetical protein